jgi:putative SOS response-associated peptidase YedK
VSLGKSTVIPSRSAYPEMIIAMMSGKSRYTTSATELGNAYAFLTCEPNPLVAPIHPKATPVILHPGDYDRWLDGDVDEVCSLVSAFSSQLMAVG